MSSEEKDILENLYRNKDISVLRQDKGRGVVLMDKCDYLEKSKHFLDGLEFHKLETDPTKSFQARVQRTLLKMKNSFTPNQYKRLYPSSSRPGRFFGLAKVHKLKDGDRNVSNLPLRPVISNIGTATYELSKYLAELLQPIAKSEYTINSTKDFVQKIRNKVIENEFEMVSFDVVSLFTSVPLDFTIDIILKKVYDEKLITTKLKREEMKTLLQLCTKDMHFSFNDTIYRQINGVTMGSALGPVIANIFMVELEKSLIPTMVEKVSLWFRYVDDTFTFIKKGEVNSVVDALNGFHENIEFTFEREADNHISFLDVKVIKNADGSFKTDIHRKSTDTNVYLSWKSYAPKSWKIGTLKGLIRRAFTICSTNEYQSNELAFLKKVFVQINGFPSKIVSRTIHKIREQMANENFAVVSSHPVPLIPTTLNDVNHNILNQPRKEEIYSPYICLPYKGLVGEQIIKKFKGVLKNTLPSNVHPRIIFKGKKIGSCFQVKDKVSLEHESNLVYAFKPKLDSERSTQYVGETNVRYGTRTHEHLHTDKDSSVYKHMTTNNLVLTNNDFEVLDKGFPRKLDRKLAEALYIKDLDPILNRQKISYNLLLFN